MKLVNIKVNQTAKERKRFLFAAVFCFGAIFAFPLFACADTLPTDGAFVAGSGQISVSGQTMNVDQATQQAIAQWQSFSIDQGYTVNFNQPNASSVILNRVTGQDPSAIFGNLNANGQVFLVNPNGVLFGATSSVNAPGIVASTLNISNEDFLNGNYKFVGQGAGVAAQGTISAPGGYVVLLGSSVENSGVISAPLGTVALAAGSKVTVGLDPQGLMSVAVDEAVTQNTTGAKDAVKNSGTISADGGTVILTAKALNNVFDHAINNTGIIQAGTLESKNGVIRLVAVGASITNNGSLSANIIEITTDASFLNRGGQLAAILAQGIANTGNITINAQDMLQAGFMKADNLIDITVSNIIATDPVVNANPDVVIQASRINLSGRQFGSGSTPLAIQADDIYINRTQGDLGILESSGIGSSVLLRGPPEGFGAVLYNKSANLTLDAEKVILLGPDPVHFFGNITFANLECTVPGKEVYFEADHFYSFLGNTHISGTPGYEGLIKLFSSISDVPWYSSFEGQQEISYVALRDAYNVGGLVKAMPSTKLSYCENWDTDPIWDNSSGDGKWSTSTNWDTNTVPTAFDTVTFNATSVANSNVDPGFAGTIAVLNISSYTGTITLQRSLTITGALTIANATNGATATLAVADQSLSAASLRITGGNGTRVARLTVSTGTVTFAGNISFAGTAGNARIISTGASTINVGGNFGSGGTLTTSGTGTINFNGSVAQTIGTYITYNNVTINNTSGGVSLTGSTTIGGSLNVNAGNLTVGGFTFRVTGATTVSGTLNITSTTGTKTFTGSVTINNGGIWNETANEAISFGGNLQNDGTFTAGTGTHTFSGAGKTISGVNVISIPNATFAGNYTNNGTLTVSSLLTVTGGAVRLTNNGTVTASTALSGTGGVTQGATGILNIGGTSGITTLSAAAVGNTVNYTGGAQTVKATTYSNLIFSGSGSKSMAAGTSVTGNLSIAPTGTAIANIGAGLTLNINSLTLGGLGRINGTWGSTSSTATYKNNTYFSATTGKLNVSADIRITPTLSIANSPVTYNGLGQTAIVTGSVAGTVSNILNGGVATQTNAGIYAVTADFTPTDITSYKSLTGASAGNFTISKANATIITTPYSGTYDGAGHNATGTATGVLGEDLSADLNMGAAFTNVPGGTANWTFTDSTGNYNNASGTESVAITPAILIFTATGVDKPYDGTDAATVTFSDDRIPGDVFTYSYTASFSDINVGTGKTINVSGVSISGGDSGNYTLSGTTATTTANITGSLSGTSDVSSGTVWVAVNGSYQAGATGSIVGGSWSIPTVLLNPGDIVTVWIDSAGASDISTGVGKYNGPGNMTGFVLNALTLSVGSDDNQSLTVGNLGLYDRDDNIDILYTANSGVLTANAGSVNATITILLGNALRIGGAQTLTATNVIINGTLTSGGASTYNIAGNWTNAGTFNLNTSTVNFDGSGTQTLISGGNGVGKRFYNLIHSGSGTLQILTNPLRVNNDLTNSNGIFDASGRNLDVNGNLNISGGTFNAPSGAKILNVAGNFTNDSTFDPGTGTVNLSGSGNLKSSGASFNNLTVNGTYLLKDALTVAGDLIVNGSLDADYKNISEGGDWSFNNLSNLNNVTLTGGGNTITSSGNTFANNLTITGNYTLNDALIVTNNLNTNAGTLDANNRNITEGGNWNFNGLSNLNSVTLTGGGNTITSSGNTFPTNLVITGSYQLLDPLIVTNNLNVLAGTLDANFQDITEGGDWRFNNLGNLANVTLTGAGYTIYPSGNTFPQNLTINGIYTLANDLTVVNDLIVNGSLDANGKNISEGGDWSFAGLSNLNNVTLTGSGSTIVSGGNTFVNNLTIAGNYTLNDALIVTNNLNTNAGTLDANNKNITEGGNWNFNGLSNLNNVTLTGAGKTITSGGNAFANNLTVTGSYTLNDALVVSNNLNTNSGSLDVNFQDIIEGGNWNFNGLSNLGNVTLNGAGKTIDSNATAFPQNLTIDGSYMLSDKLEVAGDLIVNGSLDANFKNVSEGGDWSFNNLSNLNSVTLTGAGKWITSGGNAFANNLTITGSYALNDALVVTNNMITNAGSLDANFQDITEGGNWNFNGLSNLANVTLTGSGMTITSGGNAFINNLTVTGTYQMIDPLVVTNELLVPSGTLDANFQDLTEGGNWDPTNIINLKNVTLTGAGMTITSLGTTFPSNLTISGSYQLVDALVVTDDLIVTGTLDANNQTISEGGDWSFTGLSNLSDVTLTGAAKTITSAGNSFASNLTISGSYQLVDALVVTDDLIVTGTLDANNQNINVGGNWVNSGTFTAGTGTVAFDGAGSHTIKSGGSDFYDVIFDNALGTWTLMDDLASGNDFTITNGTIDTAGNLITVTNTFENKSSVITSTGDLAITAGDIISGTMTNSSAAGDVILLATTGNISVTGTITSDNGGVSLTSDNGSITAVGAGSHIVAASDSYLYAPNGAVSSSGDPLSVNIAGNLYLDVANRTILIPTRETYGNIIGTIFSSSGIPLLVPTSFPLPLLPPGFVYYNGKQIWPTTNNVILQEFASAAAESLKTKFWEAMNNNRISSFDKATPQFYAYHPLNETDESAFTSIDLDTNAYEFIEKKIELKKQMSPYFDQSDEEKKKIKGAAA